jgi:hypothetical protein
MVTHVDDDGLRLHRRDRRLGPPGAGGAAHPPPHAGGDRDRRGGQEADPPDEGRRAEKVSKLTDLWMDVGARDRKERSGTRHSRGRPRVIDSGLVELSGRLIASRAADNRIGAYVVLEALRALATGDDRPPRWSRGRHDAGGDRLPRRGCALLSAYGLDPQVAIVVDVTFATDAPGSRRRRPASTSSAAGRCSRAAPRSTRWCSSGWRRRPRRRGSRTRSRRASRAPPPPTPTPSTCARRRGDGRGLRPEPLHALAQRDRVADDLDAATAADRRLRAGLEGRHDDPDEPPMTGARRARVHGRRAGDAGAGGGVLPAGADVERWPERLPHYRWVRFHRKDGFGTGRVEMAARRDFGPLPYPVWWVSEMRVDEDRPAVLYRHVAGDHRDGRGVDASRSSAPPDAECASSTLGQTGPAGRSRGPHAADRELGDRAHLHPSRGEPDAGGSGDHVESRTVASVRPGAPVGHGDRSSRERGSDRPRTRGERRCSDHRHRPVTPIGTGVGGAVGGSHRRRESAVRLLDRFDASPFRTHIAAQVDDFDPAELHGRSAGAAARPLRAVLHRRDALALEDAGSTRPRSDPSASPSRWAARWAA